MAIKIRQVYIMYNFPNISTVKINDDICRACTLIWPNRYL